MFDENQIVKVKWHSHNKQHFIGLGFNFTKIGDEFEVAAKKLAPKSRAMVSCVCDYCGKEYQTRYANYRLSASRGKNSCVKCKQLKTQDTLEQKYGSSSLWGISQFREKAKQSMVKKYGSEYAMQSKQGQENFKETMIDKYGYDNPIKSPELQAKAKATMYKNGNVPTSLPEKQMIEMLKKLYGEDSCLPGYPIDRVNLDCLLCVDDCKIDVEYDGLYWHQNTKEYDRKRNHWLMSKGYKVLRILGDKNDDLPSIGRLKEEVEYLLNGHNIGYIDMNN